MSERQALLSNGKTNKFISSESQDVESMSKDGPYSVFGSGQTFNSHNKTPQWKRLAIIFMVLSVLVAIAFILYAIISELKHKKSNQEPDWKAPTPSQSLLSRFKHSTVVSDAAPCTDVGNYIQLVKGGNAVDIAIATMLCTGVYNLHSMGIGGGAFMVYYDRKNNKTHTLNFREKAPLAAREDMFVNTPDGTSVYGGLAIAVPGEIIGYYKMWEKFGSLEWKELFKPIIDILKNGFHVYPSLASAVDSSKDKVLKKASQTFRDFLYNPSTGRWLKENDRVFHTKLLNTYEILSEEPMAIHNGSLTDIVVEEIRSAGGIITREDLLNYVPEWLDPMTLPLTSDLNLHVMPPPSSGVLSALIVKVMSGYGYDKKNISTLNEMTLYYHRYVEASKFAFAKRSGLGDLDFADNQTLQLMKNLSNPSYADYIRSKIDDSRTHPVEYYEPFFADDRRDAGTSHLSVVDEEGNALAMTSTINTAFASLVMGNITGILYNNQMDDFSSPNLTNFFNLPPSPSNYIKPGKRPMSSMSPTVITESDAGNVRIIIGASGGTRIISGVSQVASHHLNLHENIKQAIDHWRLHHQLLPNKILVEDTFPRSILDGLAARGHEIAHDTLNAVTQGINLEPDGYFLGNADFRKNGKSDGT